jgi:hypothetical protein
VGVRVLTRTLVLGFCALGYPARLERPGLVYSAVGVQVTALGLVFKLVRLLGFVFELPELVYLVVPSFEPLALVYPVLIFEPLVLVLVTLVFELLVFVYLVFGSQLLKLLLVSLVL